MTYLAPATSSSSACSSSMSSTARGGNVQQGAQSISTEFSINRGFIGGSLEDPSFLFKRVKEEMGERIKEQKEQEEKAANDAAADRAMNRAILRA